VSLSIGYTILPHGLMGFHLRTSTASPYHDRAFPVPKIHKDTIMKKVERLCKLGVLERQPASEWALPSFIILKTKPYAS
jgi:hypothetical protein